LRRHALNCKDTSFGFGIAKVRINFKTPRVFKKNCQKLFKNFQEKISNSFSDCG